MRVMEQTGFSRVAYRSEASIDVRHIQFVGIGQNTRTPRQREPSLLETQTMTHPFNNISSSIEVPLIR